MSCLLHGGLALAALLFVQRIQLAPQADPFKWNVSIEAPSPPPMTSPVDASTPPRPAPTAPPLRAAQAVPPSPPVTPVVEKPAPTPPVAELPPKPLVSPKPEPVRAQGPPPAPVTQADQPVKQPDAPAPPAASAVTSPQSAQTTPSIQPAETPVASPPHEPAPAVPSPKIEPPPPQPASASPHEPMAPTPNETRATQPPATAAGPQVAAVAPASQPKVTRKDYGWLSDLMARWIGDLDKRYPASLRTEGIQGKVTLTAILHEDGMLTDVRVANSSGNALLDQVAMEDVKKGPPIRLSRPLEQPQMPVKFSIIYDLKTAR